MDQFDNKCVNHPNQVISFLCTSCDNSPICCKCVTSFHRSHTIDDINLENSKELSKEFKHLNFKELLESSGNRLNLIKESDDFFTSIENQHLKHIQMIENEFRIIHNQISFIEMDLKKQLITLLDDNKETNIMIKSKIESIKSTIDSIINKHRDNIEKYDDDNYIENIFKNHLYNDNNNDNDNNNNSNTNNSNNSNSNNSNNDINDRVIEIIKHSHQLKSILKLKDNEELLLIGKYKDTSLTFNRGLFDSFKDSFKNIYTINTKLKSFHSKENNNCNYNNNNEDNDSNNKNIEIINKNKNTSNKITNKQFEYGGMIVTILENGVDLPSDVNSLALSDNLANIKISLIPQTINRLFVLNGFSQTLLPSLMPPLKFIFLGEIGDSTLVEGSIPNTTTGIILLDGFNQSLTTSCDSNLITPFSTFSTNTKSLIPSSVCYLYIGNIKTTLDYSTIPSSVRHFFKTESTNTIYLKGFENVSFKNCFIPPFKYLYK
ncbi:hypothetical protein ACTFIV_007541 [Dictyostelium citrinum]